MSWLTRWFRPTPPVRRPAHRSGTRLGVEVMEDRLAPAVLSVVHPSLANGTSTFPSLVSAQVAYTAGDVIQIEPGSIPGPLGIDNLTGQTIRGNPGFAADALPVVSVNQAGAMAQFNVTLRNLNLIFGDSLTITGVGWVIEGCAVTNAFQIGTSESLINLDSNFTTLRNNRIVGITGVAGGNVVGVTPPPAGGNNLIADNTFHAFSNLNLIEYRPVALRTVTDQVVNNTFLGQSDPNWNTELLVVAFGANITGLTIADNTFTDNSLEDQTAVAIFSASVSAATFTVRNNRISLPSVTDSSSFGLYLDGLGTQARNFQLLNNDIATNGKGNGIVLLSSTATVSKVEGNDLHRNRWGVYLGGSGGQVSYSGIDLGGGAQGSRGQNNFRGFTATATSSAGALVVGVLSANVETVFARNNIWSVPNPETVINDVEDSAFWKANVDSASPLTANQSAVAALYHTFLRRSADLTNPSGAGGWVTQLTNGTPFSTVATSIMRSAEALGRVVDKLYKSILGRDADAGGRATHVTMIVNGATVEQIQSAFFASAEYTLRFAGNAAFVHSLYHTLLGRIPAQAEVDSQVANLPAQGRQGMAAAFLASTEYRNREVTALYIDVLKRATPPTAGEVAANVNSGLDLLALRVLFAGTAEFYFNG